MTHSKQTIGLLYLFLLLSGFISLHIQGLPNPIYLFGSIIAFITLLYINLTQTYKPTLVLWVYCIILVIIFGIGIKSFESSHHVEPVYLSSILYAYSIVIGSLVTIFYKKITLAKRSRIYRYTLNILIIFMLLELVFRFVFSKNSGTFYDYKFGIIYTDSNFTALVILLFIFFYRFLKKAGIYKINKIQRGLLFILLILTFSRGAILTYFVINLMLILPKKLIKALVITIFFIIILISYFLITYPVNYFDLSWIDGSLNARLQYIYTAIYHYNDLSLINKLFGIGLNNFQYISGRFAHNIVLTFIYEFGILGTVATLILWVYCYKKIGFYFNYLLLPFFLYGMALFSAYSVMFFLFMGCMFIETGNKK